MAWRVPVFRSVECRGMVVFPPGSLSFVCLFPSEISIFQPRRLASRCTRRRSSFGFTLEIHGANQTSAQLAIGQKCPICWPVEVIHPMRFAYPYELTAQPEGGFAVTFPDIPEAITQGETEEEAAAMAEDALVTALSFYTDDAKPLPLPSPPRGRRVAHVPPLVAAKLVLHDTMLADGVSNVDLARRLRVDEKVARRLRDPLFKSRIDRVDKALRTLGKRIEISIREAADTERDAAVPESSQVDRGGDNIVPFQKRINDKQQAARRQKMQA
jgi:antitoxin HicB